MKWALAWLVCAALPFSAPAEWQFGEPLELTASGSGPHFHHLDGAGRRHVAAGPKGAAVAWEDDRSGDPQVYIAVLAGAPTRTYQLSTGEEAYEPAVVTAGKDRWLVAWEQDGRIAARIVDQQGPGPLSWLSAGAGRQVTLAAGPHGRLAAAWAASVPAGQLVVSTELGFVDRTLEVLRPAAPVAPLSDHAYQGFPAASWTGDGRLVLAWEDRRAGHTRLFYSSRDADGDFLSERQLNEHNQPPPGEQAIGLGSGVMRVTIASNGKQVRAAWLDKRNPASGYAVWGAASTDSGRSFGDNVMVQDELGSAVPQWHAGITGNQGLFVTAWDDTREAWGDDSEPGDVILSTLDEGTWSADQLVPVASGEGYQGSPAAAIDKDSALHLVWIERDDLSAPTRLWYARGTRD